MLLCRTVAGGQFGLDWRRLLDETPSPLLEQWRTMYDLEPWGDERTDEAIGTLVAHTVAAHGVPPQPPRQYMRILRKEESEQSESKMRAAFSSACRAAEQMQAETERPNPDC